MFNADDFKACIEAVLEKLPPGRESFKAALQAMVDYHVKVDDICSSDFHQRSRVRLLDRAQVELIEKLEAMCDTEQPDSAEPPPTSSSSSPAALTEPVTTQEEQ